MDELALYDVVNTPGVATDLSHISSVAVRIHSSVFELPGAELTGVCAQKISGFLPKDDGLKQALTGCDIAVIPAGIPR